METPGADTQTPAAPAARSEVPETRGDAAKRRSEPVKELSDTARRPASPSRLPSIIVGLVVAAIAGLSIWYLVRPQPLLVQGEVDATRFDIAARVDGRVASTSPCTSSGWGRTRSEEHTSELQSRSDLVCRLL